MTALKFTPIGFRPTPRWHVALCVFGGLCLLAVVVHGLLQSRENAKLERVLEARGDALRRTRAKPEASISPLQAQRMQKLNVIAGALNAPWLNVLDALEASRSPKVRLQQLDLNAGEGSLRMVLEGDSVNDVQTLNNQLLARGLVELRVEALQAASLDATGRYRQTEQFVFRRLWPEGLQPSELLAIGTQVPTGAAR